MVEIRCDSKLTPPFSDPGPLPLVPYRIQLHTQDRVPSEYDIKCQRGIEAEYQLESNLHVHKVAEEIGLT
jgi:hypothetical protein